MINNQDVKDVLIRYATSIDRRDWAGLRSCFTEECVADYGEIGLLRGVKSVATFMEEAHEHAGPTLHRLTNFVVELDGWRATSRCYVDAVITNPDGFGGHRASGYYDDELVRTARGWQISTRRFTMVLLESTSTASSVEGAPLDRGVRRW